MLAQRAGGMEAATPNGRPRRALRRGAPAEAGTRALADAAPPARKRKLTFKEKHALETLPSRMEALARDIAALQAKVADPGLYAKDPKGFADLTRQLGAAEAELAAAEDRWLELEMLREDLGGWPD
jgi:ATP-binding cassette subfamily F protein uup